MRLILALTLASGLFGQSRSAAYDAYCRDNPKMPTCLHRDLKLTAPKITLDPKFQETWGRKRPTPASHSRSVENVPAARPALRMTATPVKASNPEHLWRFVTPGTMLIVGVRLRPLRESEAWRSGMEQLRGFVPTGDAAGFLDSLDDIDEVWLSADAGRDAQPVLVMRGRFDGPVWRKQFSAADRATTSIDTLLMGTAAGIAAAKRRIAAATTSPVELTSIARKMAADHDIWIVANSQELLAKGLKPASNAPPALAHLRGLALGITLRDPLVADLTAESDSPEAAAQIMDWIRKSATDSKEWQDLGGKMEFRQEGSAIHMRLEIDAAKAQTMLAESTRRRTPAAPGKPGKVVIHGMEGGTREIPYGATQQ